VAIVVAVGLACVLIAKTFVGRVPTKYSAEAVIRNRALMRLWRLLRGAMEIEISVDFCKNEDMIDVLALNMLWTNYE
jgi:hypothetical protein